MASRVIRARREDSEDRGRTFRGSAFRSQRPVDHESLADRASSFLRRISGIPDAFIISAMKPTPDGGFGGIGQ